MNAHMLRIHEEDHENHADNDLPRCPICGAKAYVSKDIVDGYYFGWSVGCPRYKLDDGIHGITESTPRNERLSIFGLNSKEECIKKWKERVEIYLRRIR